MTTINRLLATVATLTIAVSAHSAGITGAGATFPYPVYAKWAEAYKAKTGNGMNYQSIGSGGGIAQIKAKTVDFGASDMPLKAEDLQSAGLMQFPAIVGGVVPIMNLAGIAPGALKLTGPVLADIYLGKIKKWNDKPIADLNPGLELPDDPIAVVRRSDGSGTTFVWTDYLSKISSEWKTKVGSSTAVSRSWQSFFRAWYVSAPQRSASVKLAAPTGMIMNSWKSTLLSAWAPPLRTFIIGTGRTWALAPPT